MMTVDKQEGVYAGGKAEYTGVRTFEVYSDYSKGCMDDIRFGKSNAWWVCFSGSKNIISFQVGGEALAAPAGPERHSVGSGDDGEEPEEELPLQQPVRKRHLPQPLRLRRPLDGIRVLVSFSHFINRMINIKL